MENLGCDYETPKQVVLDDERIDKGEKLFEQTAEQKANSKKYRQGDRKPTVYKLDKRERKADADKRQLIALLCASVGEVADNEPTVSDKLILNLRVANSEWCYPHQELKGCRKAPPIFNCGL